MAIAELNEIIALTISVAVSAIAIAFPWFSRKISRTLKWQTSLGTLISVAIVSLTATSWGKENLNYPKHIVAVGALISNNEDKVLLIRHPRWGWEFSGGIVEEGEDLLTATQREVEEETGIVATIGSLTSIYSNIKQPTKVMFGFLGKQVAGELRTSEESLEVGWFDRNCVLDIISHPILRDRTKDMLNFSGKVIYRVYTTEPYQIIHECVV